MSSSSNVYALKPQHAVVHRGIVPTLVTVDTPSYSTNATYGSGAAVANQYNNQLVVSNSSSAIRQHDNEVQVSIQVALDLTLAQPGFTNGELRIIPTPPTPTTPGAFAQSLPAQDPHYGLPLLQDVEIIFSDNGQPALAPAPGILQARYLYGGKLALIRYNPLTQSETPITSDDINGLFGSGVAGRQLLIRVNGNYRGYSSPN